MPDSEAVTEFKLGVRLLRDGRPANALEHFRRAAELEPQNPYYMSFVGLSLARAEMKWSPALKLCEAALSMKRNEAQLYLNLAEVYVSAGRRDDALATLEKGLRCLARDVRLKRARKRLGNRRSPVLPFLDRQHFLNKRLGIWRHRIGQWTASTRLPLLHSS
jgi:Flp pilus assembly protein TadD